MPRILFYFRQTARIFLRIFRIRAGRFPEYRLIKSERLVILTGSPTGECQQMANRIIALGGWEGRNEQSGPYCYLENGELVLDHRPGNGGSHGQQREYVMHGHDTEHPITQGLPTNWMHAQDEMYDSMRGPANIKHLLYSGLAETSTGGSGREEPLVFTVDYGKARISHIMLGHAGATLEDNPAMQCTGFQTLLLRSAEWAATGKVTQPVPDDFPTEQTLSLRKDYGKTK